LGLKQSKKKVTFLCVSVSYCENRAVPPVRTNPKLEPGLAAVDAGLPQGPCGAALARGEVGPTSRGSALLGT